MLMQSLNYTRGLDMLEFVWKLDLMMNFLIPWFFFFFFWGTLVVELPDGKTLEVGIEYPWKPENVCIAKRWVTYPNSVRLNLPRLGFPRIMVRLTGPPSSPKKSVARCRGISVSPNRFGPL